MLMTTLLNLLLINVCIVLVHESGFVAYMDDWVSNKWKFHHLPYICLCALCQTWWLSLLYIIITGQFTIPMIALCLLNAHMTKVTQPLYRTIENIVLKLIELLNRLFKLD